MSSLSSEFNPAITETPMVEGRADTLFEQVQNAPSEPAPAPIPNRGRFTYEPVDDEPLPGISSRSIVMGDDNDEGTIKTYSSVGRNIIAAQPVLAGLAPLKVEFCPTIKVASYHDVNLSMDYASNIDVTKFFPPRNIIEWRVGNSSVNLHNVIIGSMKGMVRTSKTVGHMLRIDTSSQITALRGPDWGNLKLVIAPIYAPLLGTVTDENVLKAERNLMGAFATVPNSARPVARIGSTCAAIFSRGVNPVRYIMRLASLFINAAFISVRTDNPFILLEAVAGIPPTLNIADWLTWQSAITSTASHNNYIPWNPPTAAPSNKDRQIFAILTLAGCEKVQFFSTSTSQLMSPTIWPAIDGVRMIGNVGTTTGEAVRVTAASIYEAAVVWCTRYGDINIFKECLDFVSTMFWSYNGNNVVLPYPKASFLLPEAHMTGYLLAPILQDMERLKPLVVADYLVDVPLMMFESALKAYIIAYARIYQQTTLLDSAIEQELFVDDYDVSQALTILERSTADTGAPIWMPTQYTLGQLGVPGAFGRLFGTVAFDVVPQEYIAHVRMMCVNSITAFDMLTILPTLPENTSCAGWVAPIPPSQQLLLNEMYLYADLAPMGGVSKGLRALTNSSGVEGFMVITARHEHSVRTVGSSFHHFDSRGFRRDFVNFKFTLPDGGQVRHAFRITNTNSLLEICNPLSDRYKLEWHYTHAMIDNALRVKELYGALPDPLNPNQYIREGLDLQRYGQTALARRTKAVLDKMHLPMPQARPPPPSGTGRPDHPPPPPPTSPTAMLVDAQEPRDINKTPTVYDLALRDATIARLEQAVEEIKNKQTFTTPSKFNHRNMKVMHGAATEAELQRLLVFDKFMGDDAWRAFLEKTTRVVMDLHKRDKDSPVESYGFGGLQSADIIMGAFTFSVLLEIPAGHRANFVQALVELLEMISANYPPQNTTGESQVLMSQKLQRSLNALRDLGSHLNFNPELTAQGLITHLGDTMQPKMLNKALENKLSNMDIFDFVLNGIDPFRAEGTPATPPIEKGDDTVYKLLLAHADGYLVNILPSGVLAFDSLTSKYKLLIKNLSEDQKKQLREHCAEIDAMLAEMYADAVVSASFRKGFRDPDADGDDGRGPSSSGNGASPPRDAHSGSASASATNQEAATQKASGGQKDAAENPAAQSDPDGPYCRGQDNCRFRQQMGFLKNQRILSFLARGCPCGLVAKYGGQWPTLVLTPERNNCSGRLVESSNLQKWFDSLSTVDRANYMLNTRPGTAGVEHFRTLFTANLPHEEEARFNHSEYLRRHSKIKELHEGGVLDASGDNWVPQWMALLRQWYPVLDCTRTSDFPPLVLQGGMPIVLTAKIILELYPTSGPLIELLHNRSPDSLEYEVATTIFALFQMPPRLAFEILAQDWFVVPLDRWHKAYAEIMVRVHRSGIFGRIVDDEVYLMRKFLNTTIRRKAEPDMQVEMRNRCVYSSPKTWFGWDAKDRAEKGSSRKHYLRRFYHYALINWEKVIGNMVSKERPKTINEHWSERALYTPAGASTLIKTMDTKSIDHRVAQGDRFSKKVVVEMLPDDFLERVIELKPINRASFFVKPEPGKKLRALYSSFDEEAFLGGYASQHQENHMHLIPGVMVRQTPHDVLKWMVDSDNKLLTMQQPSSYWQSTDYSDYNSEHTMAEQALIDLAAAEVWGRIGNWTGEKGFLEKAAACRWKALSYYNSWVCWGVRDISGWTLKHVPDVRGPKCFFAYQGNYVSEYFDLAEYDRKKVKKFKTWSRIINGLYSGHRDTARNNTMIHACDIAIAEETMKDIGWKWDVTAVALCGDDEDIKFSDALSASIYYATLAPVGHALNPRKQMSGMHHHEFLQMQATPSGRIEKPLNALLSTLGTGNWYTQLGLWIQTAIESCINNWWEAHARGVALAVAQRACAAYLNRLMVLPPSQCTGTEFETTGKVLEWWAYRVQDNLPPLFTLLPGEEKKRMPQFESVPDVQPSWPRQASDCYVRKQKALLKQLPKDYSNEFVEACQLDTVGTVLKTWRQRDAKHWAARFWPSRQKVTEIDEFMDFTKNVEQPTDLALFKLATPSAKKVLSESVVFSRMGVSMFIGRKLGGIPRLGEFLPPKQWAHATNIDTESYGLNRTGHQLQTNLKACLSYQKVPNARYHSTAVATASDKIRYVFMANASGKTRMCKFYRGADDLDTLWCDLYGAFRGDYKLSMPKSSFSKVAKATTEIVRASMRSNGILLGQIQPQAIARAVDDLRVEHELYYYDPGEELRMERMRRRGWTEDKVSRRAARAREFYAEAVELGWKRVENEQELVQLLEKTYSERHTPLLGQLSDRGKQEMEYVFDRTELVTRQLKIAAAEQQPSETLSLGRVLKT